MLHNAVRCSSVVLLLMLICIPSKLFGMESQVNITCEEEPIRAMFYLGEGYVLGRDLDLLTMTKVTGFWI